MNYLLDTNVISEWVKPQPSIDVVRWLVETDEDRLFLSVISIAEIRKGIELMSRGERQNRLSDWLTNDLSLRFAGRILDVNERVANHWSVTMAKSQKLGITMNSMDALLAATAFVNTMTLVTRNADDFLHLQSALINPWQSGLS
ncbi:MAG: type II toxin-antitoxin system VapC family toxin [Candidatus Melainabacteria bacterium]|nr:type II toxin-antitoxin system VapC family toxin [Candidatus Melainabacteria bacterium]